MTHTQYQQSGLQTYSRQLKAIGILWLFLWCSYPVYIAAQNGYYFFDREDIENIRSAAQTNWGRAIIDSLEKTVNERRTHELKVPLLEGGHTHQYFCPVHNVMFSFDWNKPYSHYCSLCGKYWEGTPRYDWAWVNRVHNNNLHYLTACMYLYMATSDSLYAGYIRDMLLDYAVKYPTFFEHNTARVPTQKLSGKMFGQSLDESVWANDATRAYSVAKPVMKPAEIRQIEQGYLQPCADMLLQRRAGGNWQVWHNSGLIALGVALQNDSIIHVALDDPQCGYHHLMNTQVYNDGWWNEGSPIYHYYPLRAILLSADAVRCRGINLFDGKLYNMFASPARGVYADLSFPAHNDGWYGESLRDQAPLYEIACQRYHDKFFLDILSRVYQMEKRDSPEALQNKDDPAIVRALDPDKSVCFKDAGVALLRSDNLTVVLKYGPHGGGHGHPDKLSISIHNGREELLSDLATSAYGVPDYTGWYRKTLAHSTVTVDAKDQKPTAGKLVDFATTAKGGTVEAATEKAYPGVEMSRKLILNDDKLTDIFTCTSADRHTYDYVLILTQKPSLPGKGEPMVLDDAPVYQRITGAVTRKAGKSLVCTIDGVEVKIQLLSGTGFEVITGEAPGIPPRNPTVKQTYVQRPSYPLIIRVKDKNMKIKTEWKIVAAHYSN